MRSIISAQLKQTWFSRFTLGFRVTGCLLLLSAPLSSAQNVPIVSGALGFFDSTNTGVNFFQPVAAPVVVAPLGKHFLAESRFDLRGFYEPKNGTSGPIQGSFFRSTQYLQLDYLASEKITLVAGRFLTPFGTRTTGSSNGVMARGVLLARPLFHIDYIGYFSASSSVPQFQAGRAAGDRIDVYFPGKRVEIGTSYGRFLQGTHNNSTGVHFWWQPYRFPLEVRSEYAHGQHAEGYWIETAYRLSQWKGPDSLFGRLEPVFRMQQTFRNSPGPGDGLPAANTQQADFGLDYHFPHEVRLNTSYSRKFSSTGNANIWDVSLTYRFLFPMWRGHQ
jgi:hypothetical protein